MDCKLLMICPYWPPHGGPGVQRASKFAGHLPKYGVEPLVVTRAWRPEEDVSLLPEVANVAVREAIHLPFQLLGGSSGARAGRGKRVARLKRARDWLLLPDHTITWVPFAAWRSVRWAREVKPSVLYSTSPYHASHLVALAAKRHLQIPWIADFRDPWTDDHFTHYPTSFHRWANRAMEGKVLKSADRIVTVTAGMRRDFLRSYPDLQTPIRVIYNGYDAADFVGTVEVPPAPPFTIRHIGTLYPDRKPDVFLKGFADFLARDPARASRFRVEFFGKLHTDVAERLEKVRAELSLDNVAFLPYVPHGEAIELLRQSHALLLIPGPGASTIPGKVFEYLAAHRPILTMAPSPSGVDEILGRLGDSPLRVSEEPEAVRQALDVLEQKLSSREDASLVWPSARVTGFSRSAAAKQLAALIAEIAPTPP